MITIQINSKDSLEVFIDSIGIEELINDREVLKKGKNHFHLLWESDLGTERIVQENELIKHVKVIFLD